MLSVLYQNQQGLFQSEAGIQRNQFCTHGLHIVAGVKMKHFLNFNEKFNKTRNFVRNSHEKVELKIDFRLRVFFCRRKG